MAQAKPEEVVFRSGGLELHGFLWKPEGTGPFPAVLWNHGSEKLPGSQPTLAKFYTEHSYVFFVPHRRGQGRSPGDYIQDQVQQAPPRERAQLMVELQQAEVEDVVAALNYLKAQPFVDRARIAISGCSYGGIQTLLTGEHELGIMALIPFAPGAMSWEQNVPVRDALIRAVDLAKAPVFLIQAENDYDLSPSRVLSREQSKRRRTSNQKFIQHSAKAITMGTGAFAPPPPTSGEPMFWPFLQHTRNPRREISAIHDSKTPSSR
jgi:carboxymethylenebutenolidase